MFNRLSIVPLVLASAIFGAPKMKVLIVDGQNNHKWQETTPVLKRLLGETNLFEVDVATSPAQGQDMSGFKPNFAAYQVVVSNYNGDPWAPATKDAFEKFVAGGGGFVTFHAADNSFPEWNEYNQMIALGGWGNRNEKDGPMVRLRGNDIVIDDKPGAGGHHGKRHPYQVKTYETKDPIMAPLPVMWMHAEDELYDSLRGPAKNMKLLATAFSDKSTGGTGENEPMLFTIAYGKGRIFHTTMGHDVEAMKCVGFITTLQRGTEWAARGTVTQKVPKDFPGPNEVSLRK
jgi:type 1 glutamine amidotransferase